MNTTIHTFSAELLHPVTEEIIQAEVSYRMSECGVYPNRMVWRAILVSVIEPDGVDILSQLSAETVGNLEREANAWWEDEMLQFNSRDDHEL